MQINSARQLVYKYRVIIGVGIGNYQRKELILEISKRTKIENIPKNEFHSYKGDKNTRGL